ncbi:DUF1850 family protein [Halalkaliarchaeum sp. AArc-CO]|uniref:DUF1850 domain-containing protein n=1 Tax=unclassified Halalkaliarchaeum TaxID=2678344 RepID=UPI00217F2288|nr:MULTISPECIES: DUF1850 domain-containing protein [unclassified Halalkaliarchaeum]MDR5673688.1 DUF1850 domain-containing protein [Halalkaliarchaeum sp. AArc-GB]UWG52069.1 DUF1850 family protein [Halalkaliarchaeum sp. AArc-CO]
MSRRLWPYAVLVGLAAVLSVGLFVAPFGGVGSVLSADQTLIVTDETGEELTAVDVADGAEVVIEYEHSVERTLVRDVYVVSDGKLVMDRMEFSSFGAGLPSHAEVTQQDGRYVYDIDGQEYGTLRISTGLIADHDLVVDGTRYDLSGMADGGTVEIRIR